ncbi:MAG: FAD-dependent thymidylate synthase [Candidatus Nitrosocosmicus sp.]|nr:FAD-dependent thymidylate synthase [Candidatus Nitrosocosmicus sp.]
MKFEKITPNITFVWPDEDKYELHKSLLCATTSRSHKSIEERKEFYDKKGLTANAVRFMTENLGFGDKSVSEMCNFIIEFHNVPMDFSLQFLSFEYQSPQESSSRYLRMPQDHFYKYENMQYEPGYDSYLMNCEYSISLYNKAFDDLYRFYEEKFPVENIDWAQMSEKDIKTAYNSTIKSKTADAVKIFLPMSTLTTFNTCINARALQDVIGQLTYVNLLNERSFDPFLKPLVKYLKEDEKTSALFSKLDSTINIWSQKATNKALQPKFKLKTDPFGATDHVDCYYLTPDCEIPVNQMPRENRHDRLDPTYKLNLFLFKIVSSIGAFRDMNRHRAVYKTLQNVYFPRALVPNNDMLTNFEQYLEDYVEGNVMESIKSTTLFQSALALGTAVEWMMVSDLYELSNIVELRSGKGGYWEYVRLARELAECVRKDKYNIFEHADFTTDYETSLPTLRNEMKKVAA